MDQQAIYFGSPPSDDDAVVPEPTSPAVEARLKHRHDVVRHRGRYSLLNQNRTPQQVMVEDLLVIRAALDAHVDILAHPPLGTPAPWPPALMAQIRSSGTSMIPTLKLLAFELAKEHVPPAETKRIMDETVQEFGKFAAAGGQVLFGTDVDYMTDTDPTQEYELMGQAGMSAMQILASLTTAPAARWNESARRGRIAPGMAADIVVLDGDPAEDVKRFAAVKCVVRGGRVVYVR